LGLTVATVQAGRVAPGSRRVREAALTDAHSGDEIGGAVIASAAGP
jgi:hypothetical protein